MKTPALIAAVAAVPLALWVGWGAYVTYTTEQPPYTVVKRLPSEVEIRQYAAQTWISTDYASDRGAFPVLASYIFGGNQQKENVAMTAPVITDDRMAFILPSGVTVDNAPTPDGQAIDFTAVPPRRLAVLRFSWTTPPDRVERKTRQLMEALQKNGVQTRGAPFLMRYNDPWTPPFMRRNEVAVEIEQSA